MVPFEMIRPVPFGPFPVQTGIRHTLKDVWTRWKDASAKKRKERASSEQGAFPANPQTVVFYRRADNSAFIDDMATTLARQGVSVEIRDDENALHEDYCAGLSETLEYPLFGDRFRFF